MLRERTIVKIVGDSHAIKGRIFRVYKKPFAHQGDIVMLSVIQVLPNGKIKKGDVFKAMVIRTKKQNKSFDVYSSYSDNAVVLIGPSPDVRINGLVSEKAMLNQTIAGVKITYES